MIKHYCDICLILLTRENWSVMNEEERIKQQIKATKYDCPPAEDKINRSEFCMDCSSTLNKLLNETFNEFLKGRSNYDF